MSDYPAIGIVLPSYWSNTDDDSSSHSSASSRSTRSSRSSRSSRLTAKPKYAPHRKLEKIDEDETTHFEEMSREEEIEEASILERFGDGLLMKSVRSFATASTTYSGTSSAKTPEVVKEPPKPTPNVPHPALEYPMLYFLIKRFPGLAEKLNGFYSCRWRASYPLQRRLPCTKLLRMFHAHITWGEAIFLLPFWVGLIVATLYTFFFPSISNTGHVARTALMACFVFAQHNSLLTLLMGMPFDRALFYHKLSGRMAAAGTFGHAWAFYVDPRFQAGRTTLAAKLGSTFATEVNTSGAVMALMIVGIILTSLPAVRRKMFEFFRIAHLMCVGGLVIGAFYHTGFLVPVLVSLTWGVDLFCRSIVMARHRYPRRATLKILSESVVELNFPKVPGFDYNAGQYMYLAIPQLSWLEWHPFSISSAPRMNQVTFHIRRNGNWTAALYDLAAKQSEVDLLMEGPYGNLGVDLVGSRYNMVLLISGGIGVSPMQSICDQLLYEKSQGTRELKKVSFIWTDRDPLMMQEAAVVRYSNHTSVSTEDNMERIESAFLHQNTSTKSSETPLPSQMLTLLPPSTTSDEQMEEMYDSLENEITLDAERVVQCGEIHEEHTWEVIDDEDGTRTSRSSRDEGGIIYRIYADPPTYVDLEEPSMRTGEDLVAGDGSSSVNSMMSDSSYRSYSTMGAEIMSLHQRISMAELDLSEGIPTQADNKSVTSAASVRSKTDEEAACLGEICDIQLYLTGDENGPNVPNTHRGRPNIKQIILDMREEAMSKGENKVAVCVCAPAKLTSICRKACLAYSNKDVCFDFHSESMEV